MSWTYWNGTPNGFSERLDCDEQTRSWICVVSRDGVTKSKSFKWGYAPTCGIDVADNAHAEKIFIELEQEFEGEE
jgi:hypothetical protein